MLTRQESTTPSVLKAGMLLKEGTSPPWTWHHRHFVLEDSCLKCGPLHADLGLLPCAKKSDSLVSCSYAPCHSSRYYASPEDVATGDLKGCMLLRGAKLSNTKTSRKGKFAFRLEGNGSSASHRAGREWHKWAVAVAAEAHTEWPRP